MNTNTINKNDYKEVLQLAKDKGYNQVILIGQKIWGDGAIPYQEVDEKTMLCELTLIQKWLRDDHNLSMWAFQEKRLDAGYVVYKDGKLIAHNTGRIKTYEEALLNGINEALKITK